MQEGLLEQCQAHVARPMISLAPGTSVAPMSSIYTKSGVVTSDPEHGKHANKPNSAYRDLRI